ncbi:MAG TPA: GNAT family N-acetyltransferase [Rhodoferax sp.]|nr:GNAT family N-acetyltransferase [Rhodoferax sp.]HNV59337.1 GNAT family N-acetyltransferase [Rhodoferax sp.]HPW29265.1 GNAT family N-acetyltransferase [Rhodoferax sp.]
MRLTEATAADLDRIMDLERAGFDAGHQELRSAFAQRIATFPHGSLMAWLGSDCVGCVFTEIWHLTPQPQATQFTLGHDIRERHDPVRGTELYISSMTLSPTVRGQGLGAPMMRSCMAQIARAFPQLESALLLVNATWSPARRIYEGLGFVEIARLAGFFAPHRSAPEDGIVMRRPIKLLATQQVIDF